MEDNVGSKRAQEEEGTIACCLSLMRLLGNMALVATEALIKTRPSDSPKHASCTKG